MDKAKAGTNRLILMRHAKSDWDSGINDDFLRPLSPRGRRDARNMGRWLGQNGFYPHSVLSSPSTRTRATVELVEQGMEANLASNCVWADSLYHGSRSAICRALAAHNRRSDVLIVGHNPGLEDLLVWLVRAGGVENAYSKVFPTAAVYVLDCIGELTALKRASATIVAQMRPKQLV